MKKILLFVLFWGICYCAIGTNGIDGRWKFQRNNQDCIVKIKSYEYDPSLLKIIVYYNDEAYVYVETKKVLIYDDGKHQRYRLYAELKSNNSDLGRELILSYSIGSKPTDVMGLNIGSEGYMLNRIQSQVASTGTSKKSFRAISERNANSSPSTSSNTSSNYEPTEERVPNISATFGKKGEWTFKLYSDGTFSHHKFTVDGYGRKIRDISITNGTYYITKGFRYGTSGYGGNTVHFRYANGKEEIAHLRYESGKAVLTSGISGGVGSRNEEMVGGY